MNAFRDLVLATATMSQEELRNARQHVQITDAPPAAKDSVIKLIDLFISIGEDPGRRAEAATTCLVAIDEMEKMPRGYYRPASAAFMKSEATDMSAGTEIVRMASTLFGLFFLVAAIYIYGWRDGIIVAFIFGPAIALPSLLGWIPIVGTIIFWSLEKSYILPTLFVWFPSIEPSWLIQTLFLVSLGTSIIYTLSASAACFSGRR